MTEAESPGNYTETCSLSPSGIWYQTKHVQVAIAVAHKMTHDRREKKHWSHRTLLLTLMYKHPSLISDLTASGFVFIFCAMLEFFRCRVGVHVLLHVGQVVTLHCLSRCSNLHEEFSLWEQNRGNNLSA